MILSRDASFSQASTFKEDFDAERRDREKAHSKIAEMETQYARQFNKMGDELGSAQYQVNTLHGRLREAESHYQAELSQAKYQGGERDRLVAQLQADKQKLEVRGRTPWLINHL